MNTNSRTNILVIEDNPGDFNLVKILLKDASVKHDLFHAESYFDGIDVIKNHEISLVLLDLSLPDSTGFKTLSNFLERFPLIPVIVLTGVNNEIVGNQAIKAGAQDFLVKGQFDGKLFGRSIRYSLHRFKTQLQLEATAKNLAISEKRFMEAQEMAHFGNWEMDIVSNTMKWTNEIFRIMGYNPGSINPSLSDYMNYVHIDDRKTVEAFFEKSTKDGQLHKLEHRIIVGGRTIKYVSIQAKVYFENVTNKILLVGALQDITERKLSEQIIIEKNMSSRTSKLKEEALADMSFHIRTPLSSIVNLFYLLENSATSNQQKEYIDGLKISLDDLSIMTNNLLNFSLLMSENLKVAEEEIAIKDFLYSLEKVIKIKADNASVDFSTDLSKLASEKILSDGNKITQILYNILDNVLSHSKDEGAVNLKCELEKQVNNNGNIIFRIENKGQILSSGEIQELLEAEKMLEVYNTEEQNNEQPLLGMAIASKLIKTLKGQYTIESLEGNTYYKVVFPVKTIKQLSFNANHKPEVALKILLVEDHFLNQIATKKILTTWSSLVSVDIAENGLIGVEKYREHGYDLILMDIQMPVMGGIEATKKIREKSTVPIIALTANSSKQESERCKDAGMNDYISKPFKPQDLYNKVMAQLVAINS
ncbi:MAG: CheY-like chemotaxis protein [Saprospiraceae bacterium]|jgi:CheY-like chemotaxis protein